MQKALLPLVLPPLLLACQPQSSSANDGQSDQLTRTTGTEEMEAIRDSESSVSLDADPIEYNLLTGGEWRGNAIGEADSTGINFVDDSTDTYEIGYTDIEGATHSHSMSGRFRVSVTDTDFFMVRFSYRQNGEELDRRDVLVQTRSGTIESRGEVMGSVSIPITDNASIFDLEIELEGPRSDFVRIYIYPGAGEEFPQYSLTGTGALTINEALLEITLQ